jgi:hypothetical protein
MAEGICLLTGAVLALLLGLSRRRQLLERERHARALRQAVQRLEAEAVMNRHRGPMAA